MGTDQPIDIIDPYLVWVLEQQHIRQYIHIIAMEFEEKFRLNKNMLLAFDNVLACMSRCNSQFSGLLTQEETECLNTCGYNRAFVRDTAYNLFLNSPEISK